MFLAGEAEAAICGDYDTNVPLTVGDRTVVETRMTLTVMEPPDANFVDGMSM